MIRRKLKYKIIPFPLSCLHLFTFADVQLIKNMHKYFSFTSVSIILINKDTVILQCYESMHTSALF